MKKLIQLIDKFDGPQSTLSNEEFFIREKILLYLKLFWVLSIVMFVLLGIMVSISYFFYFFYYVLCDYFMDHYESVRCVAIFLLKK